MRFLFLTVDGTHGAALRVAADQLARQHNILLDIGLYNAASLRSAADWERLERDIARADFVFGARLFGEEYVRPLERLLLAAACPVCIITSNPALISCTRLGQFVLQKSQAQAQPGWMQQLLAKFRPKGGNGEAKRQLAVLRNLAKVLKYIPGKAHDLHSYIVAHQYWIDSSVENLQGLLSLLIDRYVPGYAGTLPQGDPISYPPMALVHPDAPAPFADLASYEHWQRSRGVALDRGCVGLLAMRASVLTGNSAHLDALVRALEGHGVEVRMAYGSGLDFRPVIEMFFGGDKPQDTRDSGGWFKGLTKKPALRSSTVDGRSTIDLLLNGTGFALVGGPAESRPQEAREALAALDVPYIDLVPLSFQRIEDWRGDDTGLAPIQLALNVAIPELEGATEPLVYGGPTAGGDQFVALPDQVALLASRVARRIGLRRKDNGDKKVAVALFSFPPSLGNIGTAAFLDVFASLHRLLGELHDAGYRVEVPVSVEALRDALVGGNALLYGTDGNVAAQLSVNDYVRLFPAYRDIEPFWGRVPGELLNDGKQFHILGAQFGNVFVGIQPSFGYERDPMRLLMAKDAAPHHGFAAFYSWIDQVFKADAIIHFGTHGALEFMPGKQAGLSSTCWPTRLLGGLPNIYFYSVNNPSEATIAKRRGAATIISYLVPPLHQAGLYKGLRLLKDSLDAYRARPSADLLADIHVQAERLGINESDTTGDYIAALAHELIQIEQRMIPLGLHVLGKAPEVNELVDFLALASAFYEISSDRSDAPPVTFPRMVAAGLGWNYDEIQTQLKNDSLAQERWAHIDAIVREAMRLFIHEGRRTQGESKTSDVDAYLFQSAALRPDMLASMWAHFDELLHNICNDGEIAGLLHALDGGYTLPSPSNDVVRNSAVVPTGRNLYGLDPFRAPTTAACQSATKLVGELLERLTHEQGALPETVAVVLWGTDNLKSDCEGVAQVLALLGARPISDELGNVSSVTLIPLADLGRPRVDVVVTVSGIFRDLLHHQMDLLAEAVRLAAEADEPNSGNFVRKHALVQADELGVSVAEAATRIFANAPGSYGGNLNYLVESSGWENSGELSDAFLARKSFAYGKHGQWRAARDVMERALATVDATFQNIDSFEVGVSDIDNYYENLGGVTKSVETLRGTRPPVIVADAIATSGRLSSLEQMVRLETRAKLLNPKWYESMLAHGYEGAREIESRVNNTYGWSATAGAVEDWVYQGVAETFLLDEQMRSRLAQLNPHAATGIVRRLLEANDRGFWAADDATLDALQAIYGDLEDRLEGIDIAAERTLGR